MILEPLLNGDSHKVPFALAELLEPLHGKKRADDIRVRAYVVRSHWRKRWHPKPGYLTARKQHLNLVRKRA
jgi:hypothetical protein